MNNQHYSLKGGSLEPGGKARHAGMHSTKVLR